MSLHGGAGTVWHGLANAVGRARDVITDSYQFSTTQEPHAVLSISLCSVNPPLKESSYDGPPIMALLSCGTNRMRLLTLAQQRRMILAASQVLPVRPPWEWLSVKLGFLFDV